MGGIIGNRANDLERQSPPQSPWIVYPPPVNKDHKDHKGPDQVYKAIWWHGRVAAADSYTPPILKSHWGILRTFDGRQLVQSPTLPVGSYVPVRVVVCAGTPDPEPSYALLDTDAAWPIVKLQVADLPPLPPSPLPNEPPCCCHVLPPALQDLWDTFESVVTITMGPDPTTGQPVVTAYAVSEDVITCLRKPTRPWPAQIVVPWRGKRAVSATVVRVAAAVHRFRPSYRVRPQQ